MKTLRPLLLLCSLLFGLRGVVFAQGGAEVILFPPNTDAFPKITGYTAVYDAAGQPIHGLTADKVALWENKQPVALTSWEEIHPGVQVVLAVNPGPPLGVRDVLGVSRYEYVYLQWQSWIQSHGGTTLYDLSLTTGEGVYLRHSADFTTLSEALAAYKPDFRQSQPSLAPLETALQLSSDPTPRPAMGRAVLFLTPPLPDNTLKALARYADLARQQHTRIFVWLVAAPEQANGPSAQALTQLAQATGGTLTFFSGQETLPVLEDLFAPLGYAYRFTYLSRIRQGEQHTLRMEVHPPQGGNLTGEGTFALQILPPNPVLVDPPAQIVRAFPPDVDDPAYLEPRQQTLTVTVEFPDGHPRGITRLSLLVDGHPVAQRREPPFDTLVWDLTPYTTSESHSLSVEVEDALGLVGRSVDLRVQITVPQPPNPLIRAARHYGDYLTWGAVALAGLVLLWVILGPLPRRQPAGEPVARPRPSWHNLTQWPPTFARRPGKAPPRGKPLATLHPLPPEENGEQPAPTAPELPLYGEEVLIGSDPAQVQLVLRDPSVSPIHARLWRDEQGQFFIADRNSTAGTWVNYAPVSPYGARLEEGDIVHIGRVGFRFHVVGAPDLTPVVMPLTGDDQSPSET